MWRYKFHVHVCAYWVTCYSQSHFLYLHFVVRVGVCVYVWVWVWATHRYCSAPLSIPGHTHTSPPYTFHSCCTVGGKPSGHTQFLSSPPRTDTHRHNRHHGCHSSLHTPLLEKERNILTHVQTQKLNGICHVFSVFIGLWNLASEV